MPVFFLKKNTVIALIKNEVLNAHDMSEACRLKSTLSPSLLSNGGKFTPISIYGRIYIHTMDGCIVIMNNACHESVRPWRYENVRI